MKNFINIAFGDRYNGTSPPGDKFYTIEKNKVRWNLKLADDVTQSVDYRKVMFDLDKKFTTISSDLFDIGKESVKKCVTENTKGWQAYAYYYKYLTSLQNEMATYATKLLFTGANGIPPLVIWDATDKGRTFKINPQVIGIGSKKLEGLFAEFRGKQVALYGSVAEVLHKLQAAIILMKEEAKLLTGGGQKTRKARQQRHKKLKTRRQQRQQQQKRQQRPRV